MNGDIGYVNSDEAWSWRRHAVDMAIEDHFAHYCHDLMEKK